MWNLLQGFLKRGILFKRYNMKIGLLMVKKKGSYLCNCVILWTAPRQCETHGYHLVLVFMHANNTVFAADELFSERPVINRLKWECFVQARKRCSPSADYVWWFSLKVLGPDSTMSQMHICQPSMPNWLGHHCVLCNLFIWSSVKQRTCHEPISSSSEI